MQSTREITRSLALTRGAIGAEEEENTLHSVQFLNAAGISPTCFHYSGLRVLCLGKWERNVLAFYKPELVEIKNILLENLDERRRTSVPCLSQTTLENRRGSRMAVPMKRFRHRYEQMGPRRSHLLHIQVWSGGGGGGVYGGRRRTKVRYRTGAYLFACRRAL